MNHGSVCRSKCSEDKNRNVVKGICATRVNQHKMDQRRKKSVSSLYRRPFFCSFFLIFLSLFGLFIFRCHSFFNILPTHLFFFLIQGLCVQLSFFPKADCYAYISAQLCTLRCVLTRFLSTTVAQLVGRSLPADRTCETFIASIYYSLY